MSVSLSKLNELINSANYAKAELLLYDLIKTTPNDYNLNKNLGMVLLAQKKYQGALQSFEKCYFTKKNDVDVILNLSFLFLKVQDHTQCIRFSKEVIDIDPSVAGSYQNLATCYIEMLNFTKAKEYAEKVIDIRGGIESEEFLKYTDFINLYTDILLANKDISTFISFSQNILDKELIFPEIFIKLLKEDPSKIKTVYVSAIEKLINNPNQFENNVEKNAQLASGNICLAEFYKAKREISEEYFITANKCISTMQRTPIYARQQMYVNLVDYFSKFKEGSITEKIDPNKGEGLIFIIGMPRSGTTLTESILSTANDIVAGGEKVFFTNNLWEIFSDLKSDQPLNPQFIKELGDRYLDTIKLHRNGALYFIDKMPANFLFYKFIKLALPGSKFIHTHRNPWDNAISLFKANYQDTIIYASSFFAIATEYSNYSYLMKFWDKLSKNDAFLNMSYEELVSDTNIAIKKLWDYCGLQGEFSSKKRKSHYANTASQQQVSQEIYQTSLKKEEFIEFRDKFYDDMAQQDVFWEKRLNT
jgi:tetratricopeptide (TPR) repeat protein